MYGGTEEGKNGVMDEWRVIERWRDGGTRNRGGRDEETEGGWIDGGMEVWGYGGVEKQKNTGIEGQRV